ncbi:MAG TPA: PRC-barrel domain containing protein, partial [Halomonas sp.]|nr:PRC-barrel domain containing protein [Halomonas sp.]
MSRYKTFTKPLFGTFSAALLAGSIAAASAAQGDLQGLYSADELLDADVYSSANPAESIGEVEDILLDDDMR